MTTATNLNKIIEKYNHNRYLFYINNLNNRYILRKSIFYNISKLIMYIYKFKKKKYTKLLLMKNYKKLLKYKKFKYNFFFFKKKLKKKKKINKKL